MKDTYEYFMVNVGNAAYQEAGSSMSKGSLDAETTGTAYKVYACGIYNRDDIIIPLRKYNSFTEITDQDGLCIV